MGKDPGELDELEREVVQGLHHEVPRPLEIRTLQAYVLSDLHKQSRR